MRLQEMKRLVLEQLNLAHDGESFPLLAEEMESVTTLANLVELTHRFIGPRYGDYGRDMVETQQFILECLLD